ncbi:MAG: OmpA family protein [Nonlabens sp.]|uniref:OmpA family protein n=1 Tax=Nonlabens sp. TaxID=1888209 RepID=UPI003EF4DDD0
MKQIIYICVFLMAICSSAQITVTHSVYFDLDKDEFSFSEGKQLTSFFDDLIYKPILTVKILGYCDDRGSHDYNLDLSNRRVETVSKWLENHDIELENISKKVEGLGEIALEEELDAEETEEIRAQNRRVDVEFSLSADKTERIAIKKLRKKDLTEKEAKEIPVYEQKVVAAIKEKPTSKEIIPTAAKIEVEEIAEVENEFLDIPTKLDPPIDNTKEPFKTLLSKKLKAGQVIRLENILFYKGRSTILEESQPLLDRVAEILIAREDIHFEIHGHVCCINPSYPDAYNRDTKKSNLSHDRAKAIYKTLRSRGVKHTRMKFKGYGRTRPLGGIDKLDRRVELYITKIDPPKN